MKHELSTVTISIRSAHGTVVSEETYSAPRTSGRRNEFSIKPARTSSQSGFKLPGFMLRLGGGRVAQTVGV